MDSPYLGEIRIASFTRIPQGWQLCNGQLLQISTNQALFSVISNAYGGDGQTTFGLPNLQCRAPIGFDGNNYLMGQVQGSNSYTLSTNQLPPHNHIFNVSSNTGTTAVPTGNYFGNSGSGDSDYAPAPANTSFSPAIISPAGGSQPVNAMQPFLGLQFMIAVQGIYPSRS